MSKPSFSVIWQRIQEHEGEVFFTKKGLQFSYTFHGNFLNPNRTNWHVTKSNFEKAYDVVPFDGPGAVSRSVTGPSYVWGILHDSRIAKDDWEIPYRAQSAESNATESQEHKEPQQVQQMGGQTTAAVHDTSSPVASENIWGKVWRSLLEFLGYKQSKLVSTSPENMEEQSHQTMNQAIYNELISVATNGEKVTYGKLAPLVSLDLNKAQDRGEIGNMLGEISRTEFSAGRPLLSAIVVNSGTGSPSKGFFTLAKELGIYDGLNDEFFANAETKRVYNHWKHQK